MNTVTSTTGAPMVSVIILNYNGTEDIIECLKTLQSDGFSDKEIIVWDNGSRSDDSRIIGAMYPDIRFFRSEKNLGFAAGNNRACEMAYGTFIILLNSDTEVTRGWIEPMLAEFSSDANIVACQPKIRSLIDRTSFDYAGASGGYLDGLGFSYTRGRVVSTAEIDRGQYDNSADIDWATGACLMTRRTDYLSIGGFDELFFAYSEEIDLCMRWSRKGRRIRCAPSSLIYHRSGTTWKKKPHIFLYYKHRNSLLTLMKNVSYVQLLWVLPIRFVLEIVAALYYCMTSGFVSGLAPIRSLFLSVALMPVMFGKRGKDPAYRLSRGSILISYFFHKKKTFASLK